MSISRCYTCTWTNVEHFTQCTRNYQGIYVADTRQLLCTSMKPYIQAMHDRNIQLSRKSISQKTITPFLQRKHNKLLLKTNPRTLFVAGGSFDLSIFHRLYTTCLFSLRDQYLFTTLSFSCSCFPALFFSPFSSLHAPNVPSAP